MDVNGRYEISSIGPKTDAAMYDPIIKEAGEGSTVAALALYLDGRADWDFYIPPAFEPYFVELVEEYDDFDDFDDDDEEYDDFDDGC